jgi:hypothetical protein
MFPNNNNPLPSWLAAVRSGQFDVASQELQRGAEQVAQAEIEKRLIAAQVNSIDQANPHSKYLRETIISRVSADQRAGKIQSGDDLVNRYAQYSREESENFNRDVRPQQNSEESAYFNSRRAVERKNKSME